ncbi:MAG: class I SAM-dependent methyltransferase, partial [Candidatus Bathyarchaeum sp.]
LGHEIIGIDISKAQVESARIAAGRLGKKMEFRLCNGVDLNFECGYFNYIVMWGQAFGNVPKQENRLHLLQECLRVLKHSRRLIISVHNRDVCESLVKSSKTIKTLPGPELEPGDFILQGDSGSNTKCYWHYFTKKELIDLSNQAGFKTVECKLASEYDQEGWDTILVMVSEK